MVLAGRRTELNRWIERNKISLNEDDLIIAPDLYFVIRLYQSRQQIKEKQKEARKEALKQEAESQEAESNKTSISEVSRESQTSTP